MFNCVRFSGYKSFLHETEIAQIGYLNLFVGKNNSGKSSALDILGAACSAKSCKELPLAPSTIHLGYEIDEDTIYAAFAGKSYSQFTSLRAAKTYLGQHLWIEPRLMPGYGQSVASFSFDYDRVINSSIQNGYVDWKNYFNVLSKPDYYFLRISAERNIAPELSSADKLQPDGVGATNLIRRIVNHKQYDEGLIEDKLLSALNQIMGSDAHFDSIRVQEIGNIQNESESKWEVFLQETGNHRFPLSQSGSGLKTIILVLLNLLVIPEIEADREYAFGFEELENNLHPALQRRLYEFIYKYAMDRQTPVFITTHSHVAINMFFDRAGASLYHVIREGQVSSIKRIENYVDKAEILDDLDIKASDLLQANGIIWVEGPSDRVYVKKWLEVFGGEDVCEGIDYQFAYYGGRLLSHYSAEEERNGLINVLLINRNSAIVIDSDKRARNSRINDTKKRIQNEFNAKGLFSWITKGKEIENYLAVNAINRALAIQIPKQCKQYELFPDYILKEYAGFNGRKVAFANKVKDYIDNENVLDLEQRVKQLYRTIRLWNK